MEFLFGLIVGASAIGTWWLTVRVKTARRFNREVKPLFEEVERNILEAKREEWREGQERREAFVKEKLAEYEKEAES